MVQMHVASVGKSPNIIKTRSIPSLSFVPTTALPRGVLLVHVVEED